MKGDKNGLSHTFSTPGNSPVKWGKVQHQGRQGKPGFGVRQGQTAMIRGLTSTAPSLKKHSKIKENGLSGQSFLRLRRAKGGFALGNVPHTPESATLTVTIIPVALDPPSKPRGTHPRMEHVGKYG